MKKITPLTKETFEKLKEFGSVASFAVWADPDKPATYGLEDKVSKSNSGDISVFSDPNLLSRLKDGVIFVGLNASVHDNRRDGYTGPWANFHSDDVLKQHDYKLRHALQNSKYEGCYITDVIKNHPDKNSKQVKKHMKAHPEILADNLEVLRKELSYFQEKPVIAAVGGDAYEYLSKAFEREYTVIEVMHYSNRINPQIYRQKVLSKLDEVIS